MVLTPSAMIPLGTKAPSFSLKDVVTGKTVTLADVSGQKALLVMFICRHCPYVQHIKEELARIGRDYRSKNLAIVAVSSNDAVHYPLDAPDSLKQFATEEGFLFPLLYDETQNVAKAYSAACTPDFFLFDSNLLLVYRGQLDESRPGNGKPVDGKDLRSALEAVLSGRALSRTQRPSIGCNIKWKVS